MKNRRLFLFLIPLGIFVAALYGAELCFRLIEASRHTPVDGWAGDKLYTWGFPVEGITFEHRKPGQSPVVKGYRQKPFSNTKPTGRFRVMVLGDSYTFGEGIAQEDMYPNRLEAMLKEAFPRWDIEVINFGLRGADTVFEKFILETSINSVLPDLIVVGFCSNDPKQRGNEYSVERERFYARHGKKVRAFSSGLSAAGLLRTSKRFELMVDNLLPVFGVAPDWNTRIKNAYDPHGKEWQEFVAALQGIKDISDQKHLLTPYFLALDTGISAQELAWFRQAERAAKEAGFRTLNVEEEIRTDLKGSPLVAPWGGHASKELNHAYAKKLFSAIRNDVENYFRTKKT